MANVLSTATWNARTICNKNLKLFLQNFTVDLCLVTDTWLNPNISTKH